MYISPISQALGQFHDFVELAATYPDVRDSAKVWAINYGGNLSMPQTRAFFDALREVPNMKEAWASYDKLPDYWPLDKFGRPMCFQNAVAHCVADRDVK